MSAEIIDIKAKRPPPGNGAREALIDVVRCLPFAVTAGVAAAWAEQVMLELWVRGFKVVPLAPEDQA